MGEKLNPLKLITGSAKEATDVYYADNAVTKAAYDRARESTVPWLSRLRENTRGQIRKTYEALKQPIPLLRSILSSPFAIAAHVWNKVFNLINLPLGTTIKLNESVLKRPGSLLGKFSEKIAGKQPSGPAPEHHEAKADTGTRSLEKAN